MAGTQTKSEVNSSVRTRPLHVEWASEVFGDATFADERLRKRAEQILVDKVQHPAASINRTCCDHAAAKGAYRFLENERVQIKHVWEPYHRFSAQVVSEFTSFYVAHDTTCLSYLGLKATQGLGTADSTLARYLWMHSGLAMRQNGEALGLLHAHVWARPPEKFKKLGKPHSRAIEDKETYEWIRGVDAVAQLGKEHFPVSRPIHIMDIGGDVHEAYEAVLRHGHGCIIRCGNNRGVEGEGRYLKDTLANQPVRRTRKLEIPRHEGQPARTARVELRSACVTIRPSPNADRRRQSFTINVVRVTEVDAPAHVKEPVDWTLCTTEPIGTQRECWAVVRGYKLRWRIEDFHLVLKDGCHAERTQLKTADRIIRLTGFLAMVAVRILRLRDMARSDPGAPCTHVLEGDEWKVLWSYVHDQPVPAGTPPPTIAQAVHMIGRLGGHLGRVGDDMPGVRSLWRGMYDLELILIGYRIAGANS